MQYRDLTYLLLSAAIALPAIASADAFRFRPQHDQQLRHPSYGMQYQAPIQQAVPQYPASEYRSYDYSNMTLATPYATPSRQYQQVQPNVLFDYSPTGQGMDYLSGPGGYSSYWDLGEPQLFDPPDDLPYANADILNGGQALSNRESAARWRGAYWPDVPDPVISGNSDSRYRPAAVEAPTYGWAASQQFMPRYPSVEEQPPIASPFYPGYSGQGADVSPGSFSNWRK